MTDRENWVELAKRVCDYHEDLDLWFAVEPYMDSHPGCPSPSWRGDCNKLLATGGLIWETAKVALLLFHGRPSTLIFNKNYKPSEQPIRDKKQLVTALTQAIGDAGYANENKSLVIDAIVNEIVKMG